MTLTEFLLARITEDEAAARDAFAASDSYFGDTAADALLGLAESEGADTLALLHFGRHRPARVLAECEAKRRIVEEVAYTIPERGTDDWSSGYVNGLGHGFERALRHLAAVYADHPDYRDEWRP